MRYLRSSTAVHAANAAADGFEVTHPFHPLRGQRFALVTRKLTWGEERVVYFNAAGTLCSMLASWTSVAHTDFFFHASQGRSWFRVDDLLELALVLQSLKRSRQGARGSVK